MKWEIASEYGQEKTVLQDAGQILARHAVPPARVEEILTAVSEACLNALEHGNGLKRERMVTVLMNLSGNSCTFRIMDEGPGFDETRIYAGRDGAPGDGGARGWGFLFITSFADRIRQGRENGRFFVELEFLLEPVKGVAHDGNGTIDAN